MAALAKLRKTVLGVATVAGLAYLVRTVRGGRDGATEVDEAPARRPLTRTATATATPASIAGNVHQRPSAAPAPARPTPSADDSPGGKLPPRH